jgi:hypothetical protein
MSKHDLRIELPPGLALSQEEVQQLAQEFINSIVDTPDLKPGVSVLPAKPVEKTKVVIPQIKEVSVAKSVNQSV